MPMSTPTVTPAWLVAQAAITANSPTETAKMLLHLHRIIVSSQYFIFTYRQKRAGRDSIAFGSRCG